MHGPQCPHTQGIFFWNLFNIPVPTTQNKNHSKEIPLCLKFEHIYVSVHACAHLFF